MAKLHELLAVKTSLQGQAAKTRADLIGTFEKKRHLFEEKRITFTGNEEGAAAVVEQQSDLQTTVPSELRWLSKFLEKAMDVSHQVNVGNMQARANVTLNGDTLLSDVPATTLLELEDRMAELKEVIVAVPTLDPAKGFQADTDRGKDVFRAREVIKHRTRKNQKPIVLYDATKEHPAQTQLITVDESIGQIREIEWSGMITPARKAELLSRCEDVIRAVKQARSRANDLDVAGKPTVAKALLDYVLGAE